MAINENEFIKESARNQEHWECTPRPQVEDFVDMSTDEKSKLLVHLFEMLDDECRSNAACQAESSTCKYQRYSILEYLKKLFTEIIAGNRDYDKLLPSTIGLSANNL